MRLPVAIAVGTAIFAASIALAESPQSSPRPMPRPTGLVQPAATPATQPFAPMIRPQPRPPGLGLSVATGAKAATPAAKVTAPAKPVPTSLKGAVCGRADIRGQTLKPIVSRVKGCNVAAPVLVSAVAGVRLSPAATINCTEAAALSTWVTSGLQPAFNNQVVQINEIDSYACRPRNNVKGAKISEHGSGNAIDLSGFVLASGKTLTVAANYGAQIKQAQRAACGIFHTTLGPGSDGYHENHLHFDVAPYRGTPYCR